MYLGLYWVENMVLMEKFAFGELDGIMGGLLGFSSDERTDMVMDGRIKKRQWDYG